MSDARVDSEAMLGGRYRLVRRIASGGMGSVWEAEDTVLHRQVAVKLVAEGLSADEHFAERFRREAQAAAGLSHPNVAGVFDYGEDGDTQFIVMELIPGGTLADRMAMGPLPPEEAVGIAEGIAAALQAAHDSGIVHRDVKPGNVMLTPSGGIKVMDFGIAAAAWAAPITATGTAMGTATYLSPEQAAGDRATPASDVYSLGVVLYEMLAGHPPFSGVSPVAVATAHVHEPVPPLTEAAPGVPPHVAAACQQALAKDPALRPASAAEFARMLRDVSPEAETVVLPRAGSTAVLPAIPAEEAGTAVAPGASAASTDVLTPTRAAPTQVLPSGPAVVPPSRRPTAWLVLLLLGALVLLAIVLAAFSGGGFLSPSQSSSPSGSPAASRIAVPNVVGLSVQDAMKKLEAVGLKAGARKTAAGTPGVVAKTDPPADSPVPAGTAVTLYVGVQPAPSGGDHGKRKGKGHGD